jgi:hypothetical protein
MFDDYLTIRVGDTREQVTQRCICLGMVFRLGFWYRLRLSIRCYCSRERQIRYSSPGFFNYGLPDVVA